MLSKLTAEIIIPHLSVNVKCFSLYPHNKVNLPVRELFLCTSVIMDLSRFFRRKTSSSPVIVSECTRKSTVQTQSKLLLIHKIPPHSRRSLVIYAGGPAGPTVTGPHAASIYPYMLLFFFFFPASLYSRGRSGNTKKHWGFPGRKPPDAGDMLAHCPGNSRTRR